MALRRALSAGCAVGWLMVAGGCGGGGPLDQQLAQRYASQLLEGKIYAGSSAANAVFATEMQLGLASGQFQKLEQLCQLLEERKKIHPECSASRALIDAFGTFEISDAEPDRAYCRAHNLASWRSSWGLAARVIATGPILYRESGAFRFPQVYDAHWLSADLRDFETIKLLWDLPAEHPACAPAHYHQAASMGGIHVPYDVFPQALKLQPEEPGMARVLHLVHLPNLVVARQRDIARIQELPGQAAARYLLLGPPPVRPGSLAVQGWDWNKLEPQFRQLEARYPQSPAVFTAFARVGQLAGEQAVMLKHLQSVGCWWDADAWGQGAAPERSDWGKPLLPALAVGPEAAAFVEAPNQGLPLQAQLRDLYRRGEFLLLEAIFQQLRSLSDPRLVTAYQALSLGRNEPSLCQESLRLAEAWRQAQPDSAVARGVLGRAWLDYAWAARGEGWASEVSPGNWRLFKERLKLAEVASREAVERGNLDGPVLQALIQLELTGGGDKAAALRICEQSLRRNFRDDTTLFTMAAFVLPRWHGERDDLQRVAGHLRDLLKHDFAYARLAAQQYVTDSDTVVDWARLEASFRAAQEQGMVSPLQAQACLEAALKAKRPSLAALACQEMGDVWDPVLYRSAEEVEAVRAWAKQRGPLPSLPSQGKVVDAGYERPEPAWIVEKFSRSEDIPSGRGFLSDPTSVAPKDRAPVHGWRNTTRIPCRVGVVFGFDVELPQPLTRSGIALLTVSSPTITGPDGRQRWSEQPMVVPFGPRDGRHIRVRYRLAEPFQLRQGRWTLRLESILPNPDPNALLGQQAFELVK